MIDILLRFRFGRIAVISDVEKAFHQVLLQPSERDYLRFLWTDWENSSELVTYRFRRVPFGIISSPFILAAVITYLLKNRSTEWTDLILQNLYVDNLIIALDDIKAAEELYQNARHTFEYASMNLRAWNSNSEQFRNTIPQHFRDPSETISVLGIKWNCMSDQLSLATPKTAVSDLKNTMREILKLSSQLYDPYGWVVPVSVRAKLLLRQCYEQGYTWDQKLTDEESCSWKKNIFRSQRYRFNSNTTIYP